MKKLILIFLLFPSLAYSALDVCPSPQRTEYQFRHHDGHTVTCSSASDCADKAVPTQRTVSFSKRDVTYTYDASDAVGNGLEVTYLQTLTTKTVITSGSGTGGSTTNSSNASISLTLVCTDANPQCEGVSSTPFTFSGEDTVNQIPQSICVDGCEANLQSGTKLIFETGGFAADYSKTEVACNAFDNGSILSQDSDSETKYDLDNSSVTHIKNKEQCATDTSGNEICVPLFEANTATITDQEGRDFTVNPQSQNCGSVNGEFTCISSGGSGIATVTDENGNVFTLDTPKNPINNPTINNKSGDSDSSYTTTVNTTNNTSINNSTNSSGGDGSGSGSGNGDNNGSGTGSEVDNNGIIASNNAITSSVNALQSKVDQLKDSNTNNNNGLRSDINANASKTDTKIDNVKGSVEGLTSALTNGNGTGILDKVNQSVKDSQTAVDLGPTNQKLDTIIEEVSKLTNDEDRESNPEVTGHVDTFDSFYDKLQTVPLVMAYENISVSFSGSSCVTPSLNFSILGESVTGDLSMVCDVINDIDHIISFIMLFLFAFWGARIVISA